MSVIVTDANGNVCFGGTDNNVDPLGSSSAILGGDSNKIIGGQEDAILGGGGNIITNSAQVGILGGILHKVSAGGVGIAGGLSHVVNHDYVAVMGGVGAVSTMEGAEIVAHAKVAGRPSQTQRIEGEVFTTNATVGKIVFGVNTTTPGIAIGANTVKRFEISVAAANDTFTKSMSWKGTMRVRRAALTGSAVVDYDTTLVPDSDTDPDWTCTATVVGSVLNVNCTGAAATNIHWTALVTFTEVG